MSLIWIRVHGLVSTELHGHLPADLLESGELFQMAVAVVSQQIGLIENE